MRLHKHRTCTCQQATCWKGASKFDNLQGPRGSAGNAPCPLPGSGQVERALPLADGQQQARARDRLAGVGRQLDVVGARHHRGQVAVRRRAGRLRARRCLRAGRRLRWQRGRQLAHDGQPAMRSQASIPHPEHRGALFLCAACDARCHAGACSGNAPARSGLPGPHRGCSAPRPPGGRRGEPVTKRRKRRWSPASSSARISSRCRAGALAAVYLQTAPLSDALQQPCARAQQHGMHARHQARRPF